MEKKSDCLQIGCSDSLWCLPFQFNRPTNTRHASLLGNLGATQLGQLQEVYRGTVGGASLYGWDFLLSILWSRPWSPVPTFRHGQGAWWSRQEKVCPSHLSRSCDSPVKESGSENRAPPNFRVCHHVPGYNWTIWRYAPFSDKLILLGYNWVTVGVNVCKSIPHGAPIRLHLRWWLQNVTHKLHWDAHTTRAA